MPLTGAKTDPTPRGSNPPARRDAPRRRPGSLGASYPRGEIGKPGPAQDGTPVFRNSGRNDRTIRKPTASN
jgi:hypothetical protein